MHVKPAKHQPAINKKLLLFEENFERLIRYKFFTKKSVHSYDL
jgi:hypothetical protein